MLENRSVRQREHRTSGVCEFCARHIGKAINEGRRQAQSEGLSRRLATIRRVRFRGRYFGKRQIELSNACAGRGGGTVGDACILHFMRCEVDDFEVEAAASKVECRKRVLPHAITGDGPRTGASVNTCDGGERRTLRRCRHRLRCGRTGR